jgi:hypothetical protein
MKKLACLLLTALLVGCSQKTTAPAEQEPPLTTLDVESLYQHLDMDMDINEDVNNLLDEIDDIKAKMKD